MDLPLLKLLQFGLHLLDRDLVLIQLVQALLEQVGFELGAAGLFAATLRQQIVLPQLEHVGQDLLALAGTLQGKGIGLPLPQVGRVNKGIVVEAELILDGLLGGTQAAAGEAAPTGLAVAFSSLNLPLQGSFPREVATAQDAVGLPPRAVDHLHPGFAGPLADEIAVVAGPALSPEAPGKGVEQSRFARPVGAANASGVDPAQIQNRLRVAEKIV